MPTDEQRATAAQNAKINAIHEAEIARSKAAQKAAQEAYEKQLEEYRARSAEAERKHAEAMAKWQAEVNRVKACNAGDRTKCTTRSKPKK